MFKKVLSFIFCLCFIAGITVTNAYAYSLPEENNECSLTVTAALKNNPIEGILIEVYQVAEYSESGGSITYTLIDDFASAFSDEIDFENMTAEESNEAAALLSTIDETPVFSGYTDSNGQISFSVSEYGIYLVVQANSVDGYEEINPFLVLVPSYDSTDDTWEYNVSAEPKTAITAASDETTSDSSVSDESTSVQNKKTGDNNMIYVYAVVCVLAVGCVLIITKRRKVNE